MSTNLSFIRQQRLEIHRRSDHLAARRRTRVNISSAAFDSRKQWQKIDIGMKVEPNFIFSISIRTKAVFSLWLVFVLIRTCGGGAMGNGRLPPYLNLFDYTSIYFQLYVFVYSEFKKLLGNKDKHNVMK